jgi:hypothetical protein
MSTYLNFALFLVVKVRSFALLVILYIILISMLIVFSVFTEQVLMLGECFIVILKELVLRTTDIDEPQLTTGDIRDEIGLVPAFVLDLVGTLLAERRTP